ncbi:MAG: hypothetical protein ACO307_15210, partial [Ilumatobacteraceae bacterium]
IMGGLERGLEAGWVNVRSLLSGMGPQVSATVMPANVAPQAVMAGAGGPSITVNVTAGVGDPSEIGRQVVDTIKAYEQRNGTYWRN